LNWKVKGITSLSVARCLSRLSTTFLLSLSVSCVQGGRQSSQDNALDIISFRSLPDGSAGLEDECACLNTDIRRIEGFTDNMKHSRYSMFYLAMGREKVGVLQDRAKQIGCKLVR